MAHRKIHHLMTRDVVSIGPNTVLTDIVALLAARSISTVPVTDEHNHVLGVVSTADLLRHETGPRRTTTSRLAVFRGHRRHRAMTGATRAVELMTSPAITVSQNADVTDAARQLSRHDVKRLPVVDDDGALVGIVSKGDLLGVFLRSDRDIAEEITDRVLDTVMWVVPGTVSVDVLDGVAVVRGQLERRSMVAATLELTRQVDGVVDVISHLTFAMDDDRPSRSVPDDLTMSPNR